MEKQEKPKKENRTENSDIKKKQGKTELAKQDKQVWHEANHTDTYSKYTTTYNYPRHEYLYNTQYATMPQTHAPTQDKQACQDNNSRLTPGVENFDWSPDKFDQS